MNVPDVNVLVALHRPEHPHHVQAQQWWLDSRNHGEPITVPDLVWVGFIRVVSNRRIFSIPSSTEEAWQFVQAMRTQGVYVHYHAHPNVLDLFGVQIQESGAAADLVTDAFIASAAMSFGATLVTFDRDFRRFDGLRVVELG